jgi:hypothetical protein
MMLGIRSFVPLTLIYEVGEHIAWGVSRRDSDHILTHSSRVTMI